MIISEALGEKLGQLIQYVSTFLFSFAYGFYEGWKLTTVMLGVTPFLVGTFIFNMDFLYFIVSGAIAVILIASFTNIAQAAYGNAGALASEVLSAIKTISSLGVEKREIEKYSERVKEATRGGTKSSFIQGTGYGLSQLILNTSYAIALWYGGKLVVDEGYNGGDVR